MLKVNVRAKKYHQEEGYTGAELRLPASKSEIIDALDRARVPYGNGEYVVIPSMTATPDYLIEPLINAACPPSLAELNHLAQRLEILEPCDQYILEGITLHRPPRSMADLINATHNLDKYSFYPGFTTDKQLGEHAIDNEILPEFSSLSSEALECLDLSKVGARLRQYEGGILTRDGYIVLESTEWVQMYDDTLSERAIIWDQHDPIISLEICKHSDDRESIWLHCPASQEDMDYVLEAAHAESFDDCIIRRVQSVIPALEYSLSFDEDVGQINTLAIALKEHCMDDLPKYKAAYELEDIIDLESARSLAERIGEYTLQTHDWEDYSDQSTSYGHLLRSTGQLPELTIADADRKALFYSNDKSELDAACIGHLRGDFGGGEEFYTSWWPHNNDEMNTPVFKKDFDAMVNQLRENGMLADRSAMREYVSSVGGALGQSRGSYGYVMQSDCYEYYIRCNPSPGDYNFYIYAYDKEKLAMALEPEQTIEPTMGGM